MVEIRRILPDPSIKYKNMGVKLNVPQGEPRNILEEIVWHKEGEVDRYRENLPFVELRKQLEKAPPIKDFLAALKQSSLKPALIAEVKKASPSKGVIREDFDPVIIATAYQEAGASCISVLTDEKFFQGSFENLEKVRQAVELPLLCKDFVIYPYQIYLARVKGADAVLLIAAILSDQDLQYFVKIASALKMTALIEVHTLAELDRVLAIKGVALVGINNRNLEDFSVDLQTTCQILASRGEKLADLGIAIVSESGLHTWADLSLVQEAGANAVLIGESLVKQPDPAQAIAQLFSKD